jgi:hypothetical protein
MKEPNQAPLHLLPETLKLSTSISALLRLSDSELSSSATLALAKLAARNQEQRVIQLLSCHLSS